MAGGLYTSGEVLSVELSAPDGGRIYYTLDCSDPDENSILYTGPITISSTTILRAVSVKDGSLTSLPATASYLYDLHHTLQIVSLVTDPDKPRALDALTPRENEVLAAMAEGLSNRGIAQRLFVSLSSVEKAVSSIFDRLELPAGETTSRRVAAVLQYLDGG